MGGSEYSAARVTEALEFTHSKYGPSRFISAVEVRSCNPALRIGGANLDESEANGTCGLAQLLVAAKEGFSEWPAIAP